MPVAPNERPSGATSRPRAGAFIHGQRPWLSAAGVRNMVVFDSTNEAMHEEVLW
jgi:hypothetical protein